MTRRRPAALEAPAGIAASQEVVRVILERRDALRAGGTRHDGRRLGIVAEGGAMRGIVSGGALVGLADAGLTGVFDVAYGTSAGAINLAYFLTGQAESASRIYLDHAASPLFVNPLRLHRIIDLDWLFEHVVRARFPIDVERLRTGPTDLEVSVTHARTGRNALLSVRDRGVDVYDLLKASSAVPFYYGRSVELGGEGGGDRYLDGLASNALPVLEALAECTHVLVVLSARPQQGSARRPSLGLHDIPWHERLLLRAHPAGFRRAYLTRRRRLRRALVAASDDPRAHALYPTEDCPVPSRISRNPAALERAFTAARRRAAAAFEGPESR